MDDAGEGLFAKKSLKQVELKIIGLSNHLLIIIDHQYAGEGLFAKKSLEQVNLKIIGLSNHILIIIDHDNYQYPGEKKKLKQVNFKVCSDTLSSNFQFIFAS